MSVFVRDADRPEATNESALSHWSRAMLWIAMTPLILIGVPLVCVAQRWADWRDR